MDLAALTSCPAFLSVKPGDIVVIEKESSIRTEPSAEFWLGYVIHVTNGARNSSVNSIFQVADVDTGFIATINADLVKEVFSKRKLK